MDVVIDAAVIGAQPAGQVDAAVSSGEEHGYGAPPAGIAVPIFTGDAWVGGRMRPVRCERVGACLRVVCEGSRAFVVGPGGAWIVAEPPADAALSDSEVEALVGPVLLLALAQRGTFALHASAVATPRGVVALVGESGAGKSTLAAAEGRSWLRVADDILPFGVAAGVATAFPHYPQLKLTDREQYPRSAAAAVPLAAVFEVGSPAEDDRVHVEPLSPRNGTLTLIAHTVAARLFPEELLEAHLDACATVAAAVPAARLHYPRSLSALPDVRSAVLGHLKAAFP